MRGRPNIFQDEDLVMKAQGIFWERGFSATSMTDLSEVIGVGAGSIYNTFKGGKKEIFVKALQQRRKDLEEFRRALSRCEKPVELIREFFMSLADADKSAHKKGCIIANTVVEMTFIDEDLEREAAEILIETEQLYTAVIASEQEKGNVKSKLPPAVLGKYLITFWCGINSLRRIYPDRDTLREQIELHLQLLT